MAKRENEKSDVVPDGGAGDAPQTPEAAAASGEGGPKVVKMRRLEPMHKGGPTTADVHPDEVKNWAAFGWHVVD